MRYYESIGNENFAISLAAKAFAYTLNCVYTDIYAQIRGQLLLRSQHSSHAYISQLYDDCLFSKGFKRSDVQECVRVVSLTHARKGGLDWIGLVDV